MVNVNLHDAGKQNPDPELDVIVVEIEQLEGFDTDLEGVEAFGDEVATAEPVVVLENVLVNSVIDHHRRAEKPAKNRHAN